MVYFIWEVGKYYVLPCLFCWLPDSYKIFVQIRTKSLNDKLRNTNITLHRFEHSIALHIAHSTLQQLRSKMDQNKNIYFEETLRKLCLSIYFFQYIFIYLFFGGGSSKTSPVTPTPGLTLAVCNAHQGTTCLLLFF